jgi:hypothetical protein
MQGSRRAAPEMLVQSAEQVSAEADGAASSRLSENLTPGRFARRPR